MKKPARLLKHRKGFLLEVKTLLKVVTGHFLNFFTGFRTMEPALQIVNYFKISLKIFIYKRNVIEKD